MCRLKKQTQFLLYGSVFFILSIMMSSCGPKQDKQLESIKALIPKDSVNQLAYIEHAVMSYNQTFKASTNNDRLGRSISERLSNVITQGWDTNCGPNRAIFFSLGKIKQSIDQIPTSQLENAGIAVVFGKYPALTVGDHPEFATLNITQSEYDTQYAGKNTVVLKYVTGLSNDLNGTAIFEVSGEQLVDDLGKPCPSNCPTDTH